MFPSTGTMVNRTIWALFTTAFIGYLAFAAHEVPSHSDINNATGLSYYARPNSHTAWLLYASTLTASTLWLALCTSSIRVNVCFRRCNNCDGGTGEEFASTTSNTIHKSATVIFDWVVAATTSNVAREAINVEVNRICAVTAS